MKIIDNVEQLQSELAQSSKIVGFVPTMGAIHSGHLSLVERARRECDVVVVSIFVNPTQFNDPNDLKNYPRQVEADCKLIEGVGADFVFVPAVKEIYPEPDTRQFSFGGVECSMEGATRPGHFNGVAQVVSRLFDIVKPTKAYFGEKDFQQVAVIKSMVVQLALSVEIVVVPIVREEDGLAMSSRNALLQSDYRAAAPDIYRALTLAQSMVAEGTTVEELKRRVVSEIERGGLLSVIYFEVVDGESLVAVSDLSAASSLHSCVAVQAGNVRLIDNIKLK